MSDIPQLGSASDSDRQQLRRFLYLLAIIVATGISAAAIITAKPHLSANDRSRWCTVWSLVERGTYQIDEIVKDRKWQTIDRVEHEKHVYSTKPPLLSTMVAGVYWTVKRATGWTMRTKRGIDARVTRTVLLVVNLIPMIVALVVMALLVERYARSDVARFYVVFAAAFGTLLTPFLITLNNHTVAAFSVLFALYPTLRILCDGEQKSRYFLLAGFFTAFACCNELPAALFAVAVFGLLVKNSPQTTVKYFIPAALVPLIAFFYTNCLATGGWKPFYMYYGTEKYLFEGSYWLNPKGLDKGGDSPLVYFLHCTIGHHGIFSLSPIYLLTLAGWFTIKRHRHSPLRFVLWLSLSLTVCVLAFYLTRTANYNYGGNTAGLRWMFWLIPLWLVAMIPVLDRWGSRVWLQVVASILLAVSVFSAAYPAGNPWRSPWLFEHMQRSGWIHYD